MKKVTNILLVFILLVINIQNVYALPYTLTEIYNKMDLDSYLLEIDQLFTDGVKLKEPSIMHTNNSITISANIVSEEDIPVEVVFTLENNVLTFTDEFYTMTNNPSLEDEKIIKIQDAKILLSYILIDTIGQLSGYEFVEVFRSLYIEDPNYTLAQNSLEIKTPNPIGPEKVQGIAIIKVDLSKKINLGYNYDETETQNSELKNPHTDSYTPIIAFVSLIILLGLGVRSLSKKMDRFKNI